MKTRNKRQQGKENVKKLQDVNELNHTRVNNRMKLCTKQNKTAI